MSSISSFLNSASTAITKQALKTIQAYRKGRTDVTQFQAALKVLASADMLFKNPDTGYGHRFKDYYWLNNDHLENIDGDYREIEHIENYQIVSYGNTYVKVKPTNVILLISTIFNNGIIYALQKKVRCDIIRLTAAGSEFAQAKLRRVAAGDFRTKIEIKSSPPNPN